jgi:hypothetical protein
MLDDIDTTTSAGIIDALDEHEDLRAAIGMLKAGIATMAEVAELFGQTRQAISARCKRLGINVEANRKAWLREQWLGAVEREAVEQERRLAAFEAIFPERKHVRDAFNRRMARIRAGQPGRYGLEDGY